MMSGGGEESSCSYDAAILGAGPAGCSAAAGLAARGRRVIVFERSRFEGPRFGETLGPEVQPLLDSMGAWEAFAGLPSIPFRAVYSAWGSTELLERPSIFHPLGEGWHVDRSLVDESVAQAVAARFAIEVRTRTGFCAVHRLESGEWRVEPSDSSTPVQARFLIDTSGRGAPALASSLTWRRWMKSDRLVAASLRFAHGSSLPETVAGELLLESAELGWWYSVPQPNGGGLLVTLMTDADLLPSGGRPALEAAWHEALAKTLYTRSRVSGYGPPADALRTARADSGYLAPDSGEGWIAAGDAASAWDPLSGSGYARSLRSGFTAAAAVDRALLDGQAIPDSEGQEERFADYLAHKTKYYSVERRWPESEFWSRRRVVSSATSA